MILHNQIESLCEVTVSYLLIHIISEKKTEKWNNIANISSGNILKDFTIDNMKKTELEESVNLFCVGFRTINTNDILNIHRFLIKQLL